jgi:hypothetical protein
MRYNGGALSGSPHTRVAFAVVASALIFVGFEWHPQHFLTFLGSVVACYGLQLPLKPKTRDYLLYVLISLGALGVMLLIALHEVQKAR